MELTYDTVKAEMLTFIEYGLQYIQIDNTFISMTQTYQYNNISDVPDIGREPCTVNNEALSRYKHFSMTVCIKNILILILQHFQHIHCGLQRRTTAFSR